MSGCTRLYEDLITKPDLEQARDFARQENYNEAVNKYEQVIAQHPVVGDSVLFQLGIIYISPRNQHKDYQKALEYFQHLLKNYPESSYWQDSEALIYLIAEILIRDKKMGTQLKQIDKLEKQVEEIEGKLEQIKKVDMNLKQKKKISH